MSSGIGDATIGQHGNARGQFISSSTSHGQGTDDGSGAGESDPAGPSSQRSVPASLSSSTALPSHRHLTKADTARRPPPSSTSLSTLHMHQETMRRGPFGDADAGLATATLQDDSNRILGKRPARSPPSPTTAIGSSALRSVNQLAFSKPARQTRNIARQLLEMVSCPSCNRPYTTPVTLPCGHSTCLPCINGRLNKIAAVNQAAAGPSTRTTHVPPRLPLCTMTVPCSINGCPRSAIGQGLGVWAGFSAAYGLPDSEAWVDDETAAGSHGDEEQMHFSSAERGSLPVDGFVIGAENESLRLGVIPPQPREKAHTFAMSPFPWETDAGNSLSLRPDVTLAKAVAVLQRYAQEPPGEEDRRSSSKGRARRPLRGFATARRHGAHGSGSFCPRSATSSHASSTPSSASRRRTRTSSSLLARGMGYVDHTVQRNGRASSSTRPGATKIGRHFRSILGGSEADRESGSVAGVSAADTDDDDDDNDDEETEEGAHRHYASRRRAGTMRRAYRSVSADDEEEDDFEALDGERRGQGSQLDQSRAAGIATSINKPHVPPGLHDDQADSTANRFDGAFRSELQRQDEVGPLAPSGEDGSDDVTASAGSLSSASPTDANLGTVASTLEKLEEVFKLTTPEHLHSDLVDTLECQLCYFLLYEPTTTPCGHTFCRSCFARSLDHSSKCPLCRATMPSFAFFQNHPRNQSLMNLLTSQCGAPSATNRNPQDGDQGEDTASSTFPQEELMSLSRLGVFADSHTASASPSPAHRYGDEYNDDDEALSFGLRHLYNERAQTIEEEERRTSSWMPIFVCTLAFPTMPTNLHIFEPRYKLMVRRCLQGGGPARFGMVLPSRSASGPVPGLCEYGTMLEIKNHTMLLDGRSMLETVGWRRFKLLETSSLDGYTTGRVEYFDDVSPAEVAAEEAAVVASNRQALARREVQEHMQQQQQQSREVSASISMPIGAGGTPSTATATIQQHSVPSIREGGPGVEQDPLAPSVPLTHPAASTAFPIEQAPMMADLIRTATSFIELLRTQTQPGLFEQIVATYGAVPQPLEIDKLSWWLGMVLPIDEHAKSTLLPIRSPRTRLQMIVKWIERIEGSRRAGR